MWPAIDMRSILFFRNNLMSIPIEPDTTIVSFCVQNYDFPSISPNLSHDFSQWSGGFAPDFDDGGQSRHPVIPISRYSDIPSSRYPVIPLYRYSVIPKYRHPGFCDFFTSRHPAAFQRWWGGCARCRAVAPWWRPWPSKRSIPVPCRRRGRHRRGNR